MLSILLSLSLAAALATVADTFAINGDMQAAKRD